MINLSACAFVVLLEKYNIVVAMHTVLWCLLLFLGLRSSVFVWRRSSSKRTRWRKMDLMISESTQNYSSFQCVRSLIFIFIGLGFKNYVTFLLDITSLFCYGLFHTHRFWIIICSISEKLMFHVCMAKVVTKVQCRLIQNEYLLGLWDFNYYCFGGWQQEQKRRCCLKIEEALVMLVVL